MTFRGALKDLEYSTGRKPGKIQTDQYLNFPALTAALSLHRGLNIMSFLLAHKIYLCLHKGPLKRCKIKETLTYFQKLKVT